MFSRTIVAFCGLILFFARLIIPANRAFALASNNIPLDSPLYLYLEKLAGFGIITSASNIQGIRSFSKAEAARLALEEDRNLAGILIPCLASDGRNDTRLEYYAGRGSRMWAWQEE